MMKSLLNLTIKENHIYIDLQNGKYKTDHKGSKIRFVFTTEKEIGR